MLGSAIIVFREVIEAGLIVGIVLAVTRGIPRRGFWVAGGIVAGLAAASLVAWFAQAISDALEGYGQEIFNASILAVAVVMLATHNIWMARHGREMARDFRQHGEAVRSGAKSLPALAVVVAVAVLREGFEVVLFLYGLVASQGGTWLAIAGGGLIGVGLGVLLTALTYFGLITIPLKHLFAATSALIAFVAAGMAGQAVVFLEQADLVSVLQRPVWNTSAWLPDSELLGRVLKTVIGYSDRPSGLQVVVWFATLAAIFILMRVFAPAESRRTPSLQAR